MERKAVALLLANEMGMEKECESCKRQDETVSEKTIKENGVVGYYDRKVNWCDKCTASHNHYLLANWG